MNKLSQALQPQAAPPISQPKPRLDFQPMVNDSVKGHDGNRGGLSAAAIQIIQGVYIQEQQQQAGKPIQPQNSGLNPGWGGEGR